VFRLVHDTFHHHLAGESAQFPQLTGMVHISGVTDPDLPRAELRDAHRGLVTAGDRLGSVGQIRALLAAGYFGVFSFEPFAAEVHVLEAPQADLRRSMEVIRDGLEAVAARDTRAGIVA
jgi:2-keto-myo-inositol isomerase